MDTLINSDYYLEQCFVDGSLIRDGLVTLRMLHFGLVASGMPPRSQISLFSTSLFSCCLSTYALELQMKRFRKIEEISGLN